MSLMLFIIHKVHSMDDFLILLYSHYNDNKPDSDKDFNCSMGIFSAVDVL